MTSRDYGHEWEEPLGKEILDSGGGLKNLAQLTWLIANCPAFYHYIFGHAAEYICRNKDIVMESITHAQEKEKVEE